MPSVISGMVGHGFYNRHSAPQWAATEAILPWLDAAAASLSLTKPPETIGLADFGCSEGRNSIAVMQRLVAALRRRTSWPIQTVHSDLPTNDYSDLFRGLRPEGRSVFASPETYTAAVGGSMFDQLLPPRSVHLATTFNAIGFLSRRSVDRLPHYILPNGPSAPPRQRQRRRRRPARLRRAGAGRHGAFLAGAGRRTRGGREAAG